MTTTMTPPSERSLKFLADLTSDRDVLPGQTAAEAQIRLGTWLATPRSQKDVSAMIDRALKAPRRPKTVAPAIPAAAARYASLVPDSVPNMKFAIPTMLLTGLPKGWERQEFLFVEVKKSGRKRVVRRLLGAPGHFSRVGLPFEVRESVLRLLEKQEFAASAAHKFGEVYQICKRCGAELTDDTSRARLAGPVCYNLIGTWLSTGREPSLKS